MQTSKMQAIAFLSLFNTILTCNTPAPSHSCLSGCCVGSKPNLFLSVMRCFENLSSGEKRAERQRHPPNHAQDTIGNQQTFISTKIQAHKWV